MRKRDALAMIDDRDWERLARYVTGESSQDEAESTKRWLEGDSARERIYEGMKAGWEAASEDGNEYGVESPQWNTQAAWAKALPRLTAAPATHATPASRMKRRPAWSVYRWPIGIAAAIAVIVAGGIILRVATNNAARRAVQRAAAPMNEVATRRGQRATIQLVDGTRIALNVDSRIRYAQTYGTSTRELYLEGEGFFDVAHSTVPFVVHTAHGVVRDIGTRFLMSDYAGGAGSGVQVVVAEGVVSLAPVASTAQGTKRDFATLTASMLGRVTSEGAIEMARDVDVADYIAWTEGRLVFAQTPLRDVVQRLSRWYDIDVRLGDDELASVPYTASLTNENPDYVLRLLAASANARLKRRGQAYVLYSREINRR